MAALAMWFQDASTSSGGFSASGEKYIVIFLGLIAFSMLVQAFVYIAAGIVALKAMKAADGAVKDVKDAIAEVRRDLKTSTDEIKAKVYPVIESVTRIGATAQGILEDAAPKLKTVSGHLVDTTRMMRDSAERLQGTVGDANDKTKRQVARVDGMVTAALDTTAEIVATIEHGIKVPAQKIASTAVQVRQITEGVLDRIKVVASGLPFMQGKRAASSPGSRTAAGASAPRPAGSTPASATGPVPLIR
ncbi:MAG: hypothetical protein M3O02_06805 [Acidobacteriota bacterium]|nr:hypothetical protein [Acidobacteriota bacterium]